MNEHKRIVLSLSGISKRFGGIHALTDVSLTVREGEICGVIGPNGAGKSTLFNMIAGGAPPSEGKIEFYGSDITRLAMHQRARIGIARTYQLAHTFESMSVADNVLVGAEDHKGLNVFQALTGLSASSAARSRAEDAMRRTGIAEIADMPAARLTFGQQRLVAFARALASRPRLLLLDEPAAGLATGDIDRLCSAVGAARDMGATVLIVEHNMEVIMRLSEHLVVMHLGRKIGDGMPEDVRASEDVVEAYLGS
jgi:branched-chain amino acid transport system ATP-binding protein